MTVLASPARRAMGATTRSRTGALVMQTDYVLTSTSTWVCSVLGVLVCGVLATLYMLMTARGGDSGASNLEIGFTATSVLVLAAMISGCVIGSQEWGSGQHLYVFTAVPRRSALLAARWGVVAVVWFVTGCAAGLVVVAANRLLGGSAPPATAATIWLVAGTGLAAAQAAVIGVNIATLLHSTVLSVVATVALVSLVPVLTALQPGLHRLLPTTSLAALSSLPTHGADGASLTTALLVTLTWTGLSAAAASVRLTRSDL